MTLRPWAHRIAVSTASAAALVALAVPAEAAATATSTSTATTAAVTASSADVDYATWQKDCQAVMNQALPELKQRIANTRPGEKQAIVFDIDNTTLETDFGFSYPQPANKPVLDVAKYAQEHGVSLFFVTARPGIIAPVTDYNLKHVGYQVSGLYVRSFGDLFKDVADYKTAQRVDIEKKGFTIIANVGNSATDLSGGHAEKTYKLPDYNGQLS
ncbi:HAD family acid phosphatase [Streptomyces sp. HD]|uniref:HAD family acid phosphatase n=1 Tax=Streptomyces sp. HD TaxID=3020892 RepID=UPI0023310D47|nr:HAD family acid phosphatase [Streptomyces sp. HD]MDC0772818.1 HAD family acid phosphatase [Streptomyces sp. HD]